MPVTLAPYIWLPFDVYFSYWAWDFNTGSAEYLYIWLALYMYFSYRAWDFDACYVSALYMATFRCGLLLPGMGFQCLLR